MKDKYDQILATSIKDVEGKISMIRGVAVELTDEELQDLRSKI